MRLSRLCGKEHESRNAIATTTTITDCQTHSQLALKTSLEKRQVALKVSLGGANDKIFLTKQVSRSLQRDVNKLHQLALLCQATWKTRPI
ncbi:hypothetical protein T11_9381 [Trichinella zimbabwensis]|uniref:Uncharacterized protein n=1 Tax=Trichinella zimbabwensis TaxID=268475 RepID=A0A0V1HBB6_9BILA|nr:hypothetical protein T11_9381 [Trichinella zimbabwensis]